MTGATADVERPTAAPSVPTGPEDDPDVTAEVPVPGAVASDPDAVAAADPAEVSGDERADSETSEPGASAQVEAQSAPDGSGQGGAESEDTDQDRHRAGASDGSDATADGDDASAPSPPDESSGVLSSGDDLADEERLHELYGMPAPEDDTDPGRDDDTSGSGGPR